MTYFVHRSTMPGGQDFVVADDGLKWIPMDPSNPDYAAYLKWVAEGNEAPEWETNDAPE
jgi:hypothetical protein